ncbi:MAG: BatD family protein [Planctomycetota bacterium]
MALLAVVFVAPSGHAATDVRFSLSSQSVRVGQPVRLSIEADNAQTIETIQWPDTQGLSVAGPSAGSSERFSQTVVNGRVRTNRVVTLVHTYTFTPSEPGEYDLGSVAVVVDGSEYRSGRVRFRAEDLPTQQGLGLLVEPSKHTAYVGEPIDLSLSIVTPAQTRAAGVNILWSLDEAPVRIEAAPQTASRPSVGNLRVLGISVPVYETTRSGARVYTMRFRLTPTEPGRLDLGRAELRTHLERGVFARRFGPFRAFAEPLALDVRPLPEAGQPPRFDGILGRVSVHTSATPKSARVGEPITLDVRISGPGAASVFEPPDLDELLSHAFIVAEQPQSRGVGTNSVAFSYLLRPRTDEVDRIPAVELSYFDTERASYGVGRSSAIPIEVEANRIVGFEDSIGALTEGGGLSLEALADGLAANVVDPDRLRRNHRADVFELVRSPVVVTAVAAPPALFAASFVFGAVRRRAAGRGASCAQAGALARRRLSEATDRNDPDAAAGALAAYIGARLARPAGALDAAECLDFTDRRAPTARAEVEALLGACDAARYGSHPPETALVDQAERVITALQKESA